MKNNKLIYAWSIFIVITIIFVVGVEIYHHFQKEYNSGYQYRILISKELVSLESIEKTNQSAEVQEEGISSNPDSKFYELTKYGEIPKTSPDGVRVFDKYSAHFENDTIKKIGVAILVEDINLEGILNHVKALESAKITFIFPSYLDKLVEITKVITENGHEFFIQIPTQSSIPNNKKSEVSPFLANANLDETLSKLFYLLASVKHMIGIANTSSTLLTKSKNDMKLIGEELSRRGLAFFDCEKSNDILRQLSGSCGLLYINATEIFNPKKIDILKIKDGDRIIIRLEDFDAFLKTLSRDIALAPISISAKR